MQKLDRLSKIRSIQKKIEQAKNSAFVEVEPEELQALSEANRQDEKATEADGPPPGYFDRHGSLNPAPAPLENYVSPDPNAPLTEEEKRYANHPDLLIILAENPAEVPERIRRRAEHLQETLAVQKRSPWSWMT
jgi:hypothetical protein